MPDEYRWELDGNRHWTRRLPEDEGAYELHVWAIGPTPTEVTFGWNVERDGDDLAGQVRGVATATGAKRAATMAARRLWDKEIVNADP